MYRDIVASMHVLKIAVLNKIFENDISGHMAIDGQIYLAESHCRLKDWHNQPIDCSACKLVTLQLIVSGVCPSD